MQRKKKSTTKMGYRDVDNARQSRGIFFIEPNDEEFKPLGESWKFRCPQQCLAKIPIKSSEETHRNIGKREAKYACVVDADECTRPRLEGAGHKPHQDHITAKGTNSITHYSLVHKFIPMPQAF